MRIRPSFTLLGVAGSGTMGRGIAQAALSAGFRVRLYDLDENMLSQARQNIEAYLLRKQLGTSLERLSLATSLESLNGCDILIEAIAENLGLKQDLFKRLDALCPPPVILATNTSTLPVTAIASACQAPHRVAGMHFFNPATVLPLVEVVVAAQSSQETIQVLVSLAEQMGKTPVIVRDTPGFIVNRVARPFYGEALRILGEGAASHQQIDRILRLGGGFRMGPFQLMDLIGIDVNFAATQSIYEQAFYEPRYRPHIIQSQMVQQNALGRKTGRGFYTYGAEIQPQEKTPPTVGAAGGKIYLVNGSWGPGLVQLLEASGYTAVASIERDKEQVGLLAAIVAAGRAEGVHEVLPELDRLLPLSIPLFCQCNDVSLSEAASWVVGGQRLVGLDALFLASGPVATLVASPSLEPEIRRRAESFMTTSGRLVEWIEDTPGLVLPRIVAMLANEAAFALGEGVADAQTIDLAMKLGTHYPKGPLEWSREIGYQKIVAILEYLQAEYGEDRYRVAPLLRRWARQ